MKTQWTELARRQLEARVYCKQCGKSNLITAHDNAFFWSAFKDRPVKIHNCDHCRSPMRIKMARDGVEYLL